MRTIVLKLLYYLCVIVTTQPLAAYQGARNTKTTYIDAEWKNGFKTKDHNSNNPHVPSSIIQTTTSGYKTPSYVNTKQPLKNYYDKHNAVRLRHSRFPNLDSVLTRLNSEHQTTTAIPLSSSSRSNHRNSDDNNNNLFYESYGDDADPVYEDADGDTKDYDMPDYESWDNENGEPYNNGVNDEEGEVLEYEDENEENEWQAEGATEEGTRQEAPTSSLTQYKWQHYGTRSKVEESRRNQNYPEHSKTYEEVNAAIQHALRMNKEGRCKEPLPRVLSIQNEHPDPGKSYIPHCTVLHRCAEDTGCCPNHATKCTPKKQTLIHLYFYTTTIGKPGHKVEKLSFYNHTECACLDKSFQPTTFDDSSTSESNKEVSRNHRSNLSVRAPDLSLASSPQAIKRCKCPEEYTPHLHRGTYCTCDCLDGHIDCALIKRGKEFFSLKDRLCIGNGQCGFPTCEYGAYMRNIGRCPKKQEKLDAFAGAPTI